VKVVQIAIGKFHHFQLARQLQKYEMLGAIYCGYPWSKLQNEGIERKRVRTFPWVQTPYMALNRYLGRHIPLKIYRELEWLAQETIDLFASKTLPECDAVIALSSSGLRAGKLIQNRGGKYICDRGSTHIRYQDELLAEEHQIWNIRWKGIDQRIIAKEEKEYELADCITVPSTFNLESFVSMGIPRQKLNVISYGANIERFTPIDNRSPKKFVVLFVGQISLRKGIPYLLEAFKSFEHPKKELWIVGSFVHGMEKFKSQFNDDRIKLLGRVPNAQLPQIYAQADVFVLPSIEEGLALVQGEALASGCPIIATGHTGASNLFQNGLEGFIVPIRSSSDIKEKLVQLADIPELRAQMSRAAALRVKTIGGWSEYGKNYKNLLSKLLTT